MGSWPSRLQPKQKVEYMQQRKILYFSVPFLVAILAGYVFVYENSPFSEDWNKFLIDLADPLTALMAAIAVTAVLLSYHKEDKPYPVWLYFAIGMWAWVLAESIWSFMDFTTGEVPSVGVPDVFWLVGYGFLTFALRNQYQLVYRTEIKLWKILAIWLGIMLTILVVLAVVGNPLTLENFVNYFYPIIDFVLCVAAIQLFMTFGAGKLSWPWIGLFVMGISDALYAWLNATGQYQVSSEAGTWLSPFADTTYVAAYSILAIGFLMQYLLLRLGPEEPARPG
jgi:hypothetical protein